MLVVMAHVTRASNDKLMTSDDQRQIGPTLDKVAALPEGLGQVQPLRADTGHFSAGNGRACNARAASNWWSAGDRGVLGGRHGQQGA